MIQVETGRTKAAFSAEYQALRSTAVWFDLSDRGKVKISGRHRVRFLHGMVTHDVKNLGAGQARYCTIVTDTGKLVVDLILIHREDHFLCDVEVNASIRLISRLKHYRVAENVEFEDFDGKIGHVSIQGPHAREVVERFVGVSGFALPSMAVMDTMPVADLAVCVVRYSRTGEDGYDLLFDAQRWPEVQSRLDALDPSVIKASADVLETARIEAGIPTWGAELSESIFPLEAGLYHALSYSKGCYVGQEALLMMTDRGQPPKTLVGLRFQGSGEPPGVGMALTLDGKSVGTITSVCESPKFGGLVGLGYVKTRVMTTENPFGVAGMSWEARHTPPGAGWGSGPQPIVEPRVLA